MIPILLTVSAYSANPFVDAMDDKPVSAKFRGTEWGDNIDEGEIALTARATTTRIAKVWWGAVFKIKFSDLRSRAPEPPKISPDYFIVTDERIVLLSEENNEAAIKTVSEMDQPPAFEPSDIYGITNGSFSHEDSLWKTTVKLKGDLCIYDSNHPSGTNRLCDSYLIYR